MKVITLNILKGQKKTINNVRPHNSIYRVAFADGASVSFMVTAWGTFELIGNGLPVVVHIDNNVPTGITAA